MFGTRALCGKGYRVPEAWTDLTTPSLLNEAEEAIDLSVICISGCAEGEVRDKIDRLSDAHFITKSFIFGQLGSPKNRWRRSEACDSML